jgi:hypothetical protein
VQLTDKLWVWSLLPLVVRSACAPAPHERAQLSGGKFIAATQNKQSWENKR